MEPKFTYYITAYYKFITIPDVEKTKIFFEHIKAKDRNGTLINMPKFQYNFGYSDENND